MGRTSDAKERILEQARQLFHEKGYGAVGISDICSAAEVNKGSFYHFFPSKQQLALDVVDELWHRTRGDLEQQLLGSGSPRQRLAAYCELIQANQRACFAENGHQLGCPLANLGVEMATQDPLLRDRVLAAFDAQIGYFERLVREAQQLGEVSGAVVPRRAAEALLSFVEGKILLAKLRDDTETLGELLPEAERLLGFRPV